MPPPAKAGVDGSALRAARSTLEFRRRIEDSPTHEWCVVAAHTAQIGISSGLL
jgi:hypothetical protein